MQNPVARPAGGGYASGMARLARTIVVGHPHHVTQRGSRRLPALFGDEESSILSPELPRNRQRR